MRLPIGTTYLIGVPMLQYRNRVSPHAAKEFGLTGTEAEMFQYRNRVSPHAAPGSNSG